VLSLKCPSGHAGEGGGGSIFNEMLAVVDSKGGPRSQSTRGKLVGKEFREGDISKLVNCWRFN